MSRITDEFRTLEEISCPRGACDRSLFFVRAQRAHPVNRRVGRWALFQMTKIRTAEMITINLENVFQSDRGLSQKYSAKSSVVWDMVMLGSYLPIIIRRKVPLNNFLSISSYRTTSSTAAAIAPSPPRSRRGSRPSRDRSRSSMIRSGAGSSYKSASPDHSRRRSRSEYPDCSRVPG